MAARDTPKVSFQTLGQTVLAIQQTETASRTQNKRKNRSRQYSIELLQLAKEFSNQSPNELAYNGELSVLQTFIEAHGVSLKVRSQRGLTLLHSAASNNQIDTMVYLIDSGIEIDAVDNVGNTALHVCTINGHVQSIDLLLSRRASDKILNENKDAPLHIAVRSGNKRIVEAFLQHTHIDIVVQGYRLRTPLHIAAEHDFVDIVDAFNNCSLVIEEFKKQYSFRLCAADEDKLTPIHFAARCGSANVLDYMINCCSRHGYPVETVLQFLDEENSTPLHAAVDSGHTNVVKVLLKYGASPVVQNGTQIPSIHLACYQGRIDMVQAMIEYCGPEIVHTVATGGHTPLHLGARSIHGGQIVRYMIQQGANIRQVDNKGQTALHSSIIHGSLEAAQELIKTDQTIVSICDASHRNIIHFAVLYKRKAILNFLLQLQLPSVAPLIYQQDENHCTPLHYALQEGLGEYVSELLSSISCRITNIKDEKGSNYLHLAAKSGNRKALNTLLQNPVASLMLNETNSIGSTPLHNAAMSGLVQCVEVLLSQGAMVHKCYSGFTPFLIAVNRGHYECAKVLFESHPYQKDWTDDKGNTALHHAVISGSSNVLELCLDFEVSIAVNHFGQTFFDLIIERADSVLAAVVIQHNRWQECLDFPVRGGKPHFFVQLIKFMPNIARVALDRCHEKSQYSHEHVKYYEQFDFKYLRLTPEDTSNTIEDVDGDENEVPLLSTENEMMSSVTVKYKRNTDTTSLLSQITEKSSSGMDVLKQMLYHHRVSLLTHDLVVQYLKMKWRGYGRIVYNTVFILYVLQVLFLSSFIIVTPPTRLNISLNTFEVTPSNNTLITDVSIGSSILRFITLFICFINTLLFLTTVVTHRLRLLDITKYELIWMVGISIASTYAFLIPWKFAIYGLSFIYWEAGAVAIFSSWFTVGLFLKPYDIVGIYVTMFIEVLSTLIKALLICLLFIIAFTFAFFILVGGITPFSGLPESFFIICSYLLGEINYEIFVRRSDNGALQHPILTYVFVLLSAGILAVAVMNLLIGLAVGDIDTIKRNALLNQRSNIVRIFDKMDVLIPKRIQRKYNKRFYTIFPNKPVSTIRKVWRYIWRAIKSNNEEPTPDMYKLMEEQDKKITFLRQEVVKAQKIHNQQYEELKLLLESIALQKSD